MKIGFHNEKPIESCRVLEINGSSEKGCLIWGKVAILDLSTHVNKDTEAPARARLPLK